MTSHLTFAAAAFFAACAVLPVVASATESEPSARGYFTIAARPAVQLRTVAREVAPDVFEVDPDAIKGKRLVVPSGSGSGNWVACLGKWKGGECNGLYLSGK